MSVHQALRLAALRGPTMRQLWAVYRQAVGPTATPQGLVEALQEAGIKHPDLSGWLARHERRQAPDLRQRLLTAVVGRGPDPPAQLPGGQRRDEHGLYRDSHVVVALRRQGRGAEATWHVSAGLLLADQTPILRPAALARAVELILGE
ncbi:MAG: hypothetical protein KKB13_16830 [Chloroflexi bacterium]|nr:hypothetical protein [Chloroflexota bacterium]